MVKLSKEPKPQILIDNAETWTKEYLDCIQRNVSPSETIAHRYNNSEIKSALEKETNGKCAYCESKIKHVEYGDIEHILPKNKKARPDLYVEWENLTIACEVCNRTNKGDYYDPNLPLINPYIDNPDDYLIILGPMISARESNQRGFITEKTLNLNRAELIERRTERLNSVNSLLYAWSNESNPTIKSVLASQILEECKPDKEYSAFVKRFVISKGFPYSVQ